MSSDTFYIDILSLQGDTVELQCTTSTAGGVNDYAISRSFALMALADGMPYGNSTPLKQGISAAGGRVWEEAFHREHVGEFVARTEILRRIGVVLDERAWQNGRMEIEDGGADPDEAYPPHKFVLRVQMTDPKFLEGLTPGSRWGTTAYDAWWNDPLRPSQDRMAEVDREATYWSLSLRAAMAREKKRKPAKAAAEAGAAPAAKKTAAKKAAKAPGKKTAKAPGKKTAKAGKKTAKAGKKTAGKKTAKAGKKTAKAPAKKAAKKAAKAPAKKAGKKAAKKAGKKTAKKAGKKTAKKASK